MTTVYRRTPMSDRANETLARCFTYIANINQVNESTVVVLGTHHIYGDGICTITKTDEGLKGELYYGIDAEAKFVATLIQSSMEEA